MTIRARSGNTSDRVYVHAKVGIVDDHWLTLGSANLNADSFFNDSEVNIVTSDALLAPDTRLRLWAAHLEGDIDDATRLAYVEVLPDEKAITAVGFLRRAIAFYTAHGITVERVMTDNGSAFRSTVHALACAALGVRHFRTRPYRPRTNGKAERFILTLLAGWAYGALYGRADLDGLA